MELVNCGDVVELRVKSVLLTMKKSITTKNSCKTAF